MLTQLAYYQILGKPFIMYTGILALLFLLVTATLGSLLYKRLLAWSSFKIHPLFAALAIALALFHGLLGLSVYFGW
jgi:hypothetical protein